MPDQSPQGLPDRYLDLLEGCLTREIFLDETDRVRPLRPSGWKRHPAEAVNRVAERMGMEVGVKVDLRERRENGRDWPVNADTMVGRKRLQNVRSSVEKVIRDGVPGDLIETGVWRGGSTIMMRAVLEAHGVKDRTVYVADSFEGLPPPDLERFPQDEGDEHWTKKDDLGISVEEVQRRFAFYGLLDDQVQFVKGWFSDTLKVLEAPRFAVIRLDGDMYGSTMDALEALYPRLQPGGVCIIDDYGAIEACRQAVQDYRRDHGITEEIEEIDWTGVFWCKS